MVIDYRKPKIVSYTRLFIDLRSINGLVGASTFCWILLPLWRVCVKVLFCFAGYESNISLPDSVVGSPFSFSLLCLQAHSLTASYERYVWHRTLESLFCYYFLLVRNISLWETCVQPLSLWGEILLSMMMGRKGSRWWMCAIPYFYTSFCFWRCRDVPDYLNRSDELMREFTFVQICAKVECV
jgi:hypothetical protein